MWGDQTWEEMALAFFEVAAPRDGANPAGPTRRQRAAPAEQAVNPQAEARATAFLARFDTDGDGGVTRAEGSRIVRDFAFSTLDSDGDGITYRTIPGTHPTKGSFFTRGTSRDEYARYTEDGSVYVRNMNRLLKKWDTAKEIIPQPEFYQQGNQNKEGIIFFGTTTDSALEALDLLREDGIELDAMRLLSFPFSKQVEDFVQAHERIYVIEQNRDAQMRSLLINELEVDPAKLIRVLNFDGMPITAAYIQGEIKEKLKS
jgi:pyruvate/2-oxoacid:ferredoxin oxidoreductase alpha subunit